MAIIKSQISCDITKILSILKNIIKKEANPLATVTEHNFSNIGYSCAAKWHIPSFREPNDWDLVATASQSTLFINKVMANANFKNMKLVHYSGVGLKIVAECIEMNANGNSTSLEVELASDRVDLRKIKIEETI